MAREDSLALLRYFAGLTLTSGIVAAAINLSSEPAWESADDDAYATGCVACDIDNDGYLDLVVGNGNDMEAERNAVYYNNRGALEETPRWVSERLGYYGHADAGDIDGDGDPDVVITGFLDPHREQLYLNDRGVLGTAPAWENEDVDDSFSCALGDVDGDGDLDLATISGYFNPGPVRVYRNDGGVWAARATWETPAEYNANDCGWCDVDGDGDLDLAIAGHDDRVRLFDNRGGELDPTPIWESNVVAEHNQLTFGDVNGDGRQDLVVSDNNQGRVYLYLNRDGRWEDTPTWTSPFIRYASCVKLGDADADGDLDLATGGWWTAAQVFENVGGHFGAAPAWSYQPSLPTRLVCEQTVWFDVDNDGLRFVAGEAYAGDGNRKLFYLKHVPIYALWSVKVDGRALDPDDYCWNAEGGWLSLARAPRAGAATLQVDYTYSEDMDLAVTNWDEASPSYLFTNLRGAYALSSFAVAGEGLALKASWKLAYTSPTPDGFNLYRRQLREGAPAEKINQGLITNGPSYYYLDGAVAAGAVYDYWLEAVGGYGTRTFGPVRAAAPRAGVFNLGQNYPNPCRTHTAIPFELTAATDVTLEVYDLAGRRVRTAYRGGAAAGGHVVACDVGDLAPGVYIYRLETARGDAAARKMVVVK